VEVAFGHDRKILVERGIVGREIEVSVIGNDEPEASVRERCCPGATGTTTRQVYGRGSRSS
jgi:D-alanine-D-alanine ligase